MDVVCEQCFTDPEWVKQTLQEIRTRAVDGYLKRNDARIRKELREQIMEPHAA